MEAEFLIPIFLFGGAAAVLIVYFNNRHKERMAMIDKGLSPELFKGQPVKDWFRMNPLSSLKWGLLSVFVGLSIMFAMWLHETYDAPEGIYISSMLVAGGIALVIFYFIASRKLKREQG